jgi:hypothetical protein
VKRKAARSQRRRMKVNGVSETDAETNNEVTAVNEGERQAKKNKASSETLESSPERY